MPYTYASNIRTAMLANLSQFEEDDFGSNLGVGVSGWDNAAQYAAGNNLNHWGAVVVMGGDDEDPKAFTYGMWRWTFIVNMYTRYDGKDAEDCDQRIMDLATDFMTMMSDADVIRSIDSTGMVKVTSANYVGNVLRINDIPFLSMEFLVTVKQQI